MCAGARKACTSCAGEATNAVVCAHAMVAVATPFLDQYSVQTLHSEMPIVDAC